MFIRLANLQHGLRLIMRTPCSMIFFIEGIISMGVGAFCWFFMSDRPSACKWLTPEERELAEFRLVAEQPGQSEAIDALHSKAVRAGIFNTNTIGEPSRRFFSVRFDH